MFGRETWQSSTTLRPAVGSLCRYEHRSARLPLTSGAADEICAHHDAVRSLPVGTPPLFRAAIRRARVRRAPYREAAGEDQAASITSSFSSRPFFEALNLRERRP